MKLDAADGLPSVYSEDSTGSQVLPASIKDRCLLARKSWYWASTSRHSEMVTFRERQASTSRPSVGKFQSDSRDSLSPCSSRSVKTGREIDLDPTWGVRPWASSTAGVNVSHLQVTLRIDHEPENGADPVVTRRHE